MLAPLAEAGAREPLPSLLASQTKDVPARSLVQNSGAPAWPSTAARDPVFDWSLPLAAEFAKPRFPTLAARR
jgi:hypothetical protein